MRKADFLTTTRALSLALLLGTFWLEGPPALAAGEHAGGHGHEHHGPGGHGGPSAVGVPGDPARVSRTVDMTMSDSMRFTPATISTRAGETIRLRVRNAGKVDHELVIGSMAELKEHAELMRRFPGMEHDEPNMIRLAPGASGEIVWKFEKAGSVDFACLIPGHLEAGMAGKVAVGKP